MFGRVTHKEPGTSFRGAQEHGPVAHVWLTLQSAASSYRAATDPDGRYEFSGLPPATYVLKIEPPPGLAPYERDDKTIRIVEGHSCAEKNHTLRFDSRVQGSIRDPASVFYLYVVSAFRRTAEEVRLKPDTTYVSYVREPRTRSALTCRTRIAAPRSALR